MLRLLISLLVFIILLYFFISQISVPLLSGQPIFPILRERRNKAIKRLKEARAGEIDVGLEKKAVQKELSVDEKEKKLKELGSNKGKQGTKNG